MKAKLKPNRDLLVTSTENAKDAPLSSKLSVGIGNDILDPTGKDYVTGDSINNHRMLEQANHYIAEDEINQQNENL